MSWKLTFLAAVAIAAIAGVAVAATSETKDVTLCAARSDGAVSLASKERCARGEKKLTIARQGPHGPRGAVGEQGPTGAAGTTAPIQPEPVRLVGAASPPGSRCEESPGVFCYTTTGTFEWTNGGGEQDAPVGFQKDAAGYVHLQGAAQVVGSGGGEPPEFVFFLPSGYRPGSGDRTFAVPTCGNEFTAVRIRADGAVLAPVGVGCVVYLDGAAFHP